MQLCVWQHQKPLDCTLSSFVMDCPQGIIGLVTSARLKLLVGGASLLLS